MRIAVRLGTLLVVTACAVLPDDAPRPPSDAPVTAQVRSGPERGSASGLGCGLAVTAKHVVADRDDATLSISDRTAPARVVARSPHLDLAVLRTEPGLLEPLPFATARPGEPLSLRGAPDGPEEVKPGTFRAPPEVIGPLGAYAHGTAAGLRPGFSGGPVLDAHGRRVGILIGRQRRAPEEIVLLPESAVRAEVRRLLGPEALRPCANPVP
jgi:S1-C subfamily serine protease